MTLVVRAAADPATWDQVAEHMVRAESVPDWIRAVTANRLTELDAEHGIPLLRHVAEANDMAEPSAREWAASRLSALGDEAGERVYASLHANSRPLTADLLLGLDEIKLQAYRATAIDPNQPSRMRLRAAVTLAISTGLNDPESIDVLRGLVHSADLDINERLWAAGTLTLIGESASIAVHPSPPNPPGSISGASRTNGDWLWVNPVVRSPPTKGAYVISLLERAHPRLRRLRAYRTKVEREHGYVILPFSAHKVDIADIYVPPRLQRRSLEGKGIAEYTNDSRKVVILGGPASGKTMLLKAILVDWARSPAFSTRDRAVPVMVRLSDARWISAIEDAIADQMIRGGFTGGLPAVKKMLRKGELTLLLDGLDEVADSDQHTAVREILALSTEYPQCRTVVTSRIASYRNTLPRYFDTLVEIHPLTDDQIKDALRKWAAVDQFDAQPLIARLRADPSLRPYANSPFMLMLLAFTVSATNGLRPSKRASRREAWSAFLDLGLSILRDHRAFDVTIRDILRHLALEAHAAGYYTLSRQRLVEEVAQYSRMQGAERKDVDRLLSVLVSRSDILVADGPDSYRFVSLAMQELFAAEALHDEPSRLLRYFAVDPTQWREPVKLWCSMAARDTTDVIEAVSVRDSVLAVECLVAAERYDDDLVEIVLARVLDDPGNTDDVRLDALRTALIPLGESRSAELLHRCASAVANVRGDPRRHVSYVLLAVAGTEESIALLGSCAQGDSRAVDELASVGDHAVATLVQTANNGSVAAVDALSRIGSPLAAAGLVSLLVGDGLAAERAAIHTVITLASPDTPDEVRQAMIDSATGPASAPTCEPGPSNVAEDTIAWMVERVRALQGSP